MQAPSGTAKARFEVTYSQMLYEVGSIYFDEAKLQEITLVPPVLTASLNGPGNIQISFATQQNVNYQVLYKSSLTQPTWNPIETISGDGTTKTVSYAASDTFRFYTIRAF